jgi:hypothetical protein
MIAVKAQLLPDIKDQEKAEGEPNGQSKDIKEAVPLVPFEIAKGDAEEVPDHRSCFRMDDRVIYEYFRLFADMPARMISGFSVY